MVDFSKRQFLVMAIDFIQTTRLHIGSNVLLHLVTVPGNHTHEGLPWHVPTSRGPLIWFVTASHYVIVPTVPIVIDMTHYVIVTTVFPPDTLFRTIAL